VVRGEVDKQLAALGEGRVTGSAAKGDLCACHRLSASIVEQVVVEVES
jgi:hypothetical protein